MTQKKHKTTDALEIMNQEFFDGDPEAQKHLEQAREGVQIAQRLYDMRQKAGLSQRDLAKRVGTSASVICRLENADYEGHSVRLLQRIADAMDYRVEVRFSRKKARKATAHPAART